MTTSRQLLRQQLGEGWASDVHRRRYLHGNTTARHCCHHTPIMRRPSPTAIANCCRAVGERPGLQRALHARPGAGATHSAPLMEQDTILDLSDEMIMALGAAGAT